MLGSAAQPAPPATTETRELQGASSIHRPRDTGGVTVVPMPSAGRHSCSEPGSSVRQLESRAVGDDNAAAERAAVEKIHLLPVSREAPKAWVFAALTGLMKEGKTVRQYLYLKVRRPTKESKGSKPKTTTQEKQQKQQQHRVQQQQEQEQQQQEHQQQQEQLQQQQQRRERSSSSEAPDDEYTYIVVACLPHSGVITSSTVVFTSGSPLQPLRRVQLLALIHPNSAYARRAGVASYSEALQRGVVGEFRASSNNNSSNDGRSSQRNQGSHRLAGDVAGISEGSNSNSSSGRSGTEDPAAAPAAVAEAERRRRQLGSPFDWGASEGTSERRRRRHGPPREYNRAEEVIAAVLDDSDLGSGSGEDDSGGENEMGGGVPFRLSDAAGPEEGAAASSRDEQQRRHEEERQGQEQEQPLFRQQRTLQLNFNFPSPSGDQRVAGRGSDCAKAGAQGKGVFNLSENVLFHDFVAPYFRARSGGTSLPSSPATAADGDNCRDAAVVVFPGKKLVIKDLTFVVWATDPGNGPGFVWKDTAIYISVDPWGEYRRVHILPFADTLPTTYSFRLFEDYLQPFLKEQPWRLIRKGDIFTFRGVEFKVIATEPSTVPVARVGPETVVHFEGSLNPSLIDILPPEILSRVRRLPARVQPFAIVAAAQSLDPQLLLRVLPSGGMRGGSRGIDEGLEAAVKRQLVGPFCFSEYQRLYGHLCTRVPQEDAKKGTEKDARESAAVVSPGKLEHSQSSTSSPSAEAAAVGGELEAPCCTVCTLQLQDGTESVTLTCGHAFHWECARAWLRCSATCPNCRAQVVLPTGTPRESGDAGDSAQAHVGNAALGFVRNAWAEFFSP
ncbi:uncharacterized protein EMH_0070020 [Eimeria mitis]|uniref:RING-type E3 ubiquitin transferase n=1 Tax=Eimeria mitis TaxID=44415 RepID=U6KHU5_9EIME|nr:uncharacterized protein EMH_0070020 [Eimeria mitis]CDJ35038.1 hypothetical protein, conserved [Eimeria mitis]